MKAIILGVGAIIAIGLTGLAVYSFIPSNQPLENKVNRLEKSMANYESLKKDLVSLSQTLISLKNELAVVGSGDEIFKPSEQQPVQVGNGGTGNTAFSAGSVIYSDGSILTQNNANLFWDNTNFRLGVATATPGVVLGVDGNLIVSGTSTVSGLFATSSLQAASIAVATNTPTSIIDVGDGTGTSTVTIRGGASSGGEIILKSNDGSGCISIQAKRGAIDIGGSADLTVLLFAKVVSCP